MKEILKTCLVMGIPENWHTVMKPAWLYYNVAPMTPYHSCSKNAGLLYAKQQLNRRNHKNR